MSNNNSILQSQRDINNRSALNDDDQSAMSSFEKNKSISPRDLDLKDDQELTMNNNNNNNNNNISVQIDEIRETMNESDARTEDLEEFYMRYTEISQIQTGQSFGDLALIE